MSPPTTGMQSKKEKEDDKNVAVLEGLQKFFTFKISALLESDGKKSDSVVVDFCKDAVREMSNWVGRSELIEISLHML